MLPFREYLQIHLSEDKDPCWDGYKQLGMKKKGKKKVPNCVKEETLQEIDEIAIPKKGSLLKKIRVMMEEADPEPKKQARGHWLRRGGHIDDNDKEAVAKFRKKASKLDQEKGVKTSPTTDARKYTRDGIRPYNKGPKQASSDTAGKRKDIRDRIKRINNPPKKPDDAGSNHRMTDILNHPYYKKIAKKD